MLPQVPCYNRGKHPTHTHTPSHKLGEYPKLHLLKKCLQSCEPQQPHVPVMVAAPMEEVLVDAAMVPGQQLTKEGSVLP